MSDQYNYPPPPSRGHPMPQPDDVVPSIEVSHLASSEPQAPAQSQSQSQSDTQPQQPQAPAKGTAKAKGPAKPRAPRAKPLSKKQQGKLPEQTAQKTPKKTPKPRKTQPKTARKRSLDEAEVASSSGSAEKKVARENNHPSHPSNTRKVAAQQPTPRQTASFDRSSVRVNSFRGSGPSTYDDYLDDVIGYQKSLLRSSSSRRSSGQQAAEPSEEQDQDPIDLTQDDSMAEQIDPQLQEQPPVPVSAVHPDSNTRMIGSVSLTRANLGLNTNLTPSEIIRRFFMIDQELEEQVSRVPTLPPSTLAQQPPKEFVGAYYRTIPDAQDPRLDAFVEYLNRPLLEKSKTIDLERNNIAAKGTRNRRDEALKKYRRLANDQQVELNWWRLKACSLGADPFDWDAVPQDAKQAMKDDMDNRVLEEEEKIAANEKKQKSQLHSLRNTENAQRLREDSKRKEKIVQQYWAALQQGDVNHVDFLEQQYLQEKAAATSAGNSNTNGTNASASATVGNTPITAGENVMDAEGENESFDAVDAGENNPFNTVGGNNVATAGNAFNADFSTAFGNTSAFNNVANYANSNGTGIGFGNGYQNLSTLADQNAIGGFDLSASNQLMLNQPQTNSAFQANQIPDYGFQNNLFGHSQVQSNQPDNTASMSEQVQDSNFQVNPYEDNPFMNNNFVTNNFPTSSFANNNLKNNNFTNNNIKNNDLANTVSQPEQDQIGGLMNDNSGLQQPQEAQYPVHESPTTDALTHNTQASQVFSPSVAASGSSNNNNQNMSFSVFNTIPDNILSNPPNIDAAQSNNMNFDQATEFPERDLFSFDDEF
ncbi:hypothetical protein BKA59DRAFT_458061 [Fusarium tricinctum]|uniref:Uncharacterized protein n=1 Tax=Fusarium tricinctum TaxID=61284 RepID=A0A8K0RQ23_9HYPO|nr:hypothetical protein BKA59DRAFT_458061 [Fusarium tricinctum]